MLKNLIWMLKFFYEILDFLNLSLYTGNRDYISKLALVAKMMNTKIIISLKCEDA